MKRILSGLALVLVMATGASAQIAVPNTLAAGTTISAAPLNTNFSTIANSSLNRLSGGTISGNVTMDPGITIDGIDIGATVCPTCTLTIKDLVLATPATGITVNGNVIINATGKIPAITSTYFTALAFDAANLTGTAAAINGSLITTLNATNLSSGTVNTARLGGGVADATTFLRGDGSWQQAVPQNAVLFFEAACPTGYTDQSATYGGRTVVIVPAGGTLSATVGTALTNGENRPTGVHNHGVTDPGHIHGLRNQQTLAGGGLGLEVTMNIAGFAYQSESAVTGISIQNSAGVAGTNAPYVQLRACKKN